MDSIHIKGKLKHYLRIPFYFIFVSILLTIGVFFYDHKWGLCGLLFSGVYIAVVFIGYSAIKSNLSKELVTFAMLYGTVQRKILEKLSLGYALMDKDGKILWSNGQFKEICGVQENFSLSVTRLFPQITKELIQKAEKEAFSVDFQYQDRFYSALIQKFFINENKASNEIVTIGAPGEQASMYGMILFDNTQLKNAQEEIENQKLVVGIIYIDNYDEAVDTVEDVKKSMLTAMIERKLQRYFSESEAVIRKLEKDRFFIIFKKKYLDKLEEDKFSLLEDIKTLKVGNDTQITLSIGIGLGGETYSQNAEYARLALGLALGRGGAQAVVKNAKDVHYFGHNGKEVEKGTRVKARVKAQALHELMETRDRVIVMGHSLTDYDAFGAAVGIYCAARELGKPCHIVVNQITRSLRPMIEVFMEAEDYEQNFIVNSEQAMELVSPKTLIIVVDTNRPSYTECPALLDKRATVVFDHHRLGRDQIEAPLLSYIEPYASSTCEMIAEILQYFSEHIHLRPHEADCLYAGMLIDTNNFMTKTGVRTFEAAAYLRRSGAEVTRVRKLLREDMNAYKARAEVVRQAQVYKNMFAISVCEAGELESPTIVGAQAANELLNIVGIKASFVLTDYKQKIYVSSRSIDEIDVQLIMERLGGGGHLNIAGAQIADSTLEEVTEKIYEIIDQMIEEGEITV